MILFCCCVILVVIGQQAVGIVIRGMDGPRTAVTTGTDIALHCRFDLDDDQLLYAVKWFRGDREFFRYQPQLVPPVRLFPVDDVDVDMDASNGEKLVIRHVVPATSGVYRCEVSAEETFETHYRELNVTILDAPMGDPVIYNIQSSYRLGDELRINCTSFESRHAAAVALSWHLNGNLKSDEEVIEYPTRWTPLETSSVGLHIRRLAPGHFRHGQLTLTCTAQLGPSYARSTTVRAVLDRRPPLPSAATTTTTTTTTTAAAHPHDRPAPVVNPLRPGDADKRPSSSANLTGTACCWPVIVAAVLWWTRQQ